MEFRPTSLGNNSSNLAQDLCQHAGVNRLTDKSVLVLSLTAILNIHFAAELEIVKTLLSEGANVHLLLCDTNLATCHPNPSHLLSICKACRSTSRRTIQEVFGDNPQLHLHTISSTVRDCSSSEDGNLEHLKMAFSKAAHSSAATAFKDPNEKSQEFHTLICAGELAARTVYENVTRLLLSEPFQLVICFNGRFSEDAGAVAAAREAGCPVVTHERSSSGHSIRIFPNAATHSLDYVATELREIEASMSPANIAHEAELFYTAQRFGLTAGLHGKNLFVGEQNETTLPVGFIDELQNIAVFLSSEDEFTVLDEWSNPYGKDQFLVLQDLTRLDELSRYRLWIRVHPSLANRVGNSLVGAVRKLASERIQVIEAESPISSYQLAERCQNVICFGSTIGAEAAYWGCNTILLGRAEYESLECCHRPNLIEDIPQLIAGGPPEDAVFRAMVYGAFRRREYFGYSSTSLSRNQKFLVFDGHQIRASHSSRLQSRILRLFGR